MKTCLCISGVSQCYSKIILSGFVLIQRKNLFSVFFQGWGGAIKNGVAGLFSKFKGSKEAPIAAV